MAKGGISPAAPFRQWSHFPDWPHSNVLATQGCCLPHPRAAVGRRRPFVLLEWGPAHGVPARAFPKTEIKPPIQQPHFTSNFYSSVIFFGFRGISWKQSLNFGNQSVATTRGGGLVIFDYDEF